MKKFYRGIGLVLSAIIVLGLCVFPVSAETLYLPLKDVDEFYAHEITFDDLFFAYPNQTKYSVEFESDYIKSIFSVDNLVFVREELSKEIKEKPSVGDIHFYGANDVQGYVYFDEKSVFISKFVPDSSNKRDSQTYQGWFTYKNKQVYQELIEYLKQQGEKELQKEEIKQFDLRAQSQTGILPKELFTPENNVSDLKETKSEEKKEELNVKEETPEKVTDDKKQEEQKDNTEQQDEKTPVSDEKENITDDTQKNEKPEEQSDEQPPAENNYPKHIQAMNDWAQPYVKRATDMGWLIEDIFSGDLQRDMLREDFCVLAAHMLDTCGMDTAALSLGIPPFSDTQNQSVNALYRLGIVRGKSAEEFAPQDGITREEAATILYRMCKVLEIKDVYTDYRLSGYMFADTESFSDWATESIYNIYLHGVMQGIGDDFFDPKSPYSMEQAITTMIRLYDKKEAEK